MMCTGRTLDSLSRRKRYLRFTDTDTPSPDGATMVVNRFGCVSMVVRKSPISLFLFSTLCATNKPATRHARIDHVEETLIVAFPRVQEDEVELSLDAREWP